MVAEARRVAQTPGDESSFRALDLNLPQKPGTEMLCPVDELMSVFRRTDASTRSQRPLLPGLSTSAKQQAARRRAAIWPETGRVETWLAFGDLPDAANAFKDGVTMPPIRRWRVEVSCGPIRRPDRAS